jgi:hypothetical protein
MTGMLQNV